MLSDDEECAWSPTDSDDDSQDQPSATVTDPEEWQDYHSEELVTLWHLLRDRISSLGVYVLDECHISDFTDFCFRFSSGKKPPC